MRCHPTRWLWGLIPIAMLSWLAVHLETGSINAISRHRSAAALRAAGDDWASVAFSGRDGLLVGQAPEAGQREEAAASCAMSGACVSSRPASPLAEVAPAVRRCPEPKP